ncbi:MAG: DUF1292 domain-containing protein [Clostridia bacterium]|nr:DUF1292 domain-containing protein [Clostridia bacterium]
MNKDQELSLIEKLLDQDNLDTIVLKDENSNPYEFEQVAIIPNDGRLYCILHPITKIEGIADDEAIVFECTEDDKLTVVEDEDLNLKIFDKYYELIDQQIKRRKK